MSEIRIININTEKFNPFGATEEELLANALDEAGLISSNTMINDLSAQDFCKIFFDKRENYRESTKLGNLLIRKKVISNEKLQEALEYQKQHPEMKLGNILLDLNICTPEDIEKCINTQNQIREDIKELDSFKDKINNIKQRLKNIF